VQSWQLESGLFQIKYLQRSYENRAKMCTDLINSRVKEFLGEVTVETKLHFSIDTTNCCPLLYYGMIKPVILCFPIVSKCCNDGCV
jgi:hypothetical protein